MSKNAVKEKTQETTEAVSRKRTASKTRQRPPTAHPMDPEARALNSVIRALSPLQTQAREQVLTIASQTRPANGQQGRAVDAIVAALRGLKPEAVERIFWMAGKRFGIGGTAGALQETDLGGAVGASSFVG